MKEKEIILGIFILVVVILTLIFIRKDEQRDNFDGTAWNDDVSYFVGETMREVSQLNYCKNASNREPIMFAQCFMRGIRSKFTPDEFFYVANQANSPDPEKVQYIRELNINCAKAAGCTSLPNATSPSWNEADAEAVRNTITNMARSGFCSTKGDPVAVGNCFQSKIADKYTEEQYFSQDLDPAREQEKKKYVRSTLFGCFQAAGCDVPH